jgi:hypothetical protein
LARSRQANSRDDVAAQLGRVQFEIDKLGTMVGRYDPSLPPKEISANWIRGIQSARRRREKVFGDDLFADPAWDILLELFAVQLEGGRAAVSDLCNAAAVPYTTALRSIRELERADLIVRTHDHQDRRRIWVDLSRTGNDAMRRFFREPESGAEGI